MHRTRLRGFLGDHEFKGYEEAVREIQASPEAAACFGEKVLECAQGLRGLEERHAAVRERIREIPDTREARDSFQICTDYYLAQRTVLEREKRKWLSLLPSAAPRRDELDVAAAKAVPLEDVLSARGHEPRSRGGARLSYLCPFHAERTPSLVVFVEDNRFHCFGCGKRGDAIDAVMELDSVAFVPACKALLGRTEK